MATIAWVVMKHHKKTDGTYNPKIRITQNRTVGYIHTQIFTTLVRFKRNEQSGTITDPDIEDSLNGKVKDLRSLLNKYEHVVENCVKAKDVIAFIDKKMNQDKNIDFIAFAKTYTDSLKAVGSKSVKNCLIVNLCLYLHGETLPVAKLTSSFLYKFEKWMKSTRTVTVNGKERTKRPVSAASVQTYMQALQAIYNKMLLHYNDYELGDMVIQGDPFKVYSPKQDFTTEKKAVDASVIRKISAYVPGKSCSKYLDFARDMFMLSFYTAGMNMADIYTCDSYVDGRINYNRQKTRGKKKDHAFISIPVVPEARYIFTKYRDISGKRVFNLYQQFGSKQLVSLAVWNGLRIICRELGIETITYYAARHSFATIARNDCNVSMDDIALSLTHASGYNITDTYVKQDFSRVDVVIRKVVDFVFKDEANQSHDPIAV